MLDAVVHDGDLPVVGLGEDWTPGLGDDWTVGLGLWRWPRLSFFVEYALFAGAAVLVVPGVLLVPVLIVGALFHAMTVNASFGLASTNPAYDAVAKRVDLALGTSNPAVVETLFATHVIGGYVGITVALWLVLGS